MKELIKNSIDWDQMCWRYFRLDRFISSLREESLYFAAASQFEDDWEGATYINSVDVFNGEPLKRIEIFNNAFKELQRLTKINCWHKSNYENYAMWKLYAHDNKGVAITTTPRLMRLSIKPYRLNPNYCEEQLIIGNVNYLDLEIENGVGTMLSQFFNKHVTYSYENEIRIAISLRLAEEFGVSVPDNGIKVKVDYSQLIDSIIIGPNIENKERKILEEVIEEMGLESMIRESCLSKKPWFF